MRYDEARKLADEADNKHYWTAGPLTIREESIRLAAARHRRNHFDELLDRLRGCTGRLEHNKLDKISRRKCILTCKKTIAKCEEVEGL